MGRKRGQIALLISGLAVATACGDNLNIGPVGEDQSVETNEDTPVDILLVGSDANGDELGFEIVQSPASGTLSGTAPNVTYTPDPDFFGADMFTYAVSDAEETETFEVVIMVLPVNDAPVVETIDNQSGDEDVGVGPITVVVSDVDDDIANLAVSASSSNLALIDATGIEIDRTTGDIELSLTPLADQSGDSTIGVIVTDPSGLEDSTSFDVTIAAVNDAPTISDITDQTTVRDPVNDIAFTVGDIDNAVSGLVLSASSSDQAVVPDAAVTFGGADANRTVSVAPIASGTATITVTVSDGTDSSDDVFTFDVTNNAPNAVTDSYAGVGNTVLVVDNTAGLLANDSDDDGGDTISVVPETVGTVAGGTATIAADGSFSYRPGLGDNNIADSFSYQLTDGFDVSLGTATVNLAEAVWYVDNQATPGGTGEFDSRFDTLAAAEAASAAGDIIFVFEGDGSVNGMDAGIALKDGQQLIGNGVDLVVNGIPVVGAAGNPLITNTSGDGVNLADNNTVAGLTIDQPSNRGIAGTQLTSVAIHDVTVNIGDSTNTAINLNNNGLDVAATIDVTDCTITGAGTGTPQKGIVVEVGNTNGTSTLEADISRNTISLVNDGILVALEGATGSDNVLGANIASLDNNEVFDFSGAAIDILVNDASVNDISISNSRIDGDSGAGAGATPDEGINVRSNGTGSTTLSLSFNTINDAGADAIQIAETVDGGGNSNSLTAVIEDSVIDNSGQRAMDIVVSDTQTYTVSLRRNAATNSNNDLGLRMFSNAGATLDVLLENNEDNQGFELDCNNSGNGALSVGGDPNAGNFPASITCDTAGETALAAELDGLGNTTGGGGSVVTLGGTSTLTFNLIDPAGFPN